MRFRLTTTFSHGGFRSVLSPTLLPSPCSPLRQRPTRLLECIGFDHWIELAEERFGTFAGVIPRWRDHGRKSEFGPMSARVVTVSRHEERRALSSPLNQ